MTHEAREPRAVQGSRRLRLAGRSPFQWNRAPIFRLSAVVSGDGPLDGVGIPQRGGQLVGNAVDVIILVGGGWVVDNIYAVGEDAGVEGM